MFKKIFKTTTKTVRNTTGSIIEGIDEGLNGDDVKEVRQEKRVLKAEARRLRQQKRKRISLYWRIAWVGLFTMVGRTIYMNGFHTDTISKIAQDYQLALLLPFLVAGILTLIEGD